MSRLSKKALLPAPSIAQAVEYFIADLSRQHKEKLPSTSKVSGFNGVEKRNFIIAVLLGAGSGVVFWFSSDKAADRYLRYGMFFNIILCQGWFPPLGGAVTNALFNIESYFTLGDAIAAMQTDARESNSVFTPPRDRLADSSGSENHLGISATTAERTLTRVNHEKIEWIAGGIIAFFGVLPFWFASLSDETMVVVLGTISAFLNLPVNADGSKNLIDWLKSFDFKDRLCDLITASICCEASSRNKHLALRKARNLIVDHLQQQVAAFKSDDKDGRNMNVLGAIDVDKQWSEIFNNLLSLNLRKPKTQTISCGSHILFYILTATSFWANGGYIVDSYNGGKKLWDNNGWGWFCAILHMIPGIGFTMKGIINVKQRMLTDQKSLERNEMPITYGVLCTLMVLFAIYSGYTADEMGYQGWLQVISDDKTAATISGVISNIGTALMFNLPQCLFLAQRIIEIYLMKFTTENDVQDDIVFAQNVSNLARILQKMPMNVCENFFNDEAMPRGNLLTFLLSALQRDEISADEIKLIGDFYRKNFSDPALQPQAVVVSDSHSSDAADDPEAYRSVGFDDEQGDRVMDAT